MPHARTLGLLALVGCLVVAGCAGSPGSEAVDAAGTPAAADAAATPAATEAAAAESGGDGGGRAVEDDASSDQAADEARAQPALIKEGTVVLRVDDFDRVRRALVEENGALGGFVADSGVTRHREDERTWQTGYVVLRVPSGEFQSLLAATRAEGTVVSEETRTRDVSDQLVDIEARLENLEAKRERLRDFYDRANDTEELLLVEERLAEVQGEIERLEARKRALEDQVAYSTLRVEIREPSPTPMPTPTPTPEPKYHEQSLGAAFAASVDRLVVLGKSALVTAAYALPYLLVAAIPVGLVGGLAWWRRR